MESLIMCGLFILMFVGGIAEGWILKAINDDEKELEKLQKQLKTVEKN